MAFRQVDMEDGAYQLGADAPGEVVAWRLRRLLEAGYPIAAAELIADCVDVDLHLAVRLAADGCPAETALRILL